MQIQVKFHDQLLFISTFKRLGVQNLFSTFAIARNDYFLKDI